MDGNAAYLNNNLHLQMKRNWQVFRFSDLDPEGNDIYRSLDFLGFRFYRNRTVLRKTLIKSIRSKAHAIYTQGISLDRAESYVSYSGWINASDTHVYYLNYIAQEQSFRDAEAFISETMKRRTYESELRNSYRITG